MAELKPCPFCGGEASVDYYDGYFYVGCDLKFNCPNNVFMTQNFYKTESEAVEAWNTRHEPKTPAGAYTPARGERLKW